jgi:hypothetical protein
MRVSSSEVGRSGYADRFQIERMAITCACAATAQASCPAPAGSIRLASPSRAGMIAAIDTPCSWFRLRRKMESCSALPGGSG